MNHVEASFEALIAEAVTVKDNMNAIEYTGERKKQQETRLGMVALELLCRKNEWDNEDPRLVFAFSDVDYFGLHVDAPGLKLGTARVDYSR